MADEWYFTAAGQQMGPVSDDALRQMAQRGQLKPSDLVWRDGMSTWAPASATRGLFPASPPPAPSSLGGAPTAVLTPPGLATASLLPSRRPIRDDEEDLSDLRPGRVRRGMSQGAKATLIGGITVLAILALLAGGIIAALVTTGVESRQQHSYEIKLNVRDEKNTKFIHFKQDQQVHISVIAKRWGPGGLPDVDLYVYGPDGHLFDLDDAPEKDCDLRFIAPQTGDYKIEVHLCEGNWALCTVRH